VPFSPGSKVEKKTRERGEKTFPVPPKKGRVSHPDLTLGRNRNLKKKGESIDSLPFPLKRKTQEKKRKGSCLALFQEGEIETYRRGGRGPGHLYFSQRKGERKKSGVSSTLERHALKKSGGLKKEEEGGTSFLFFTLSPREKGERKKEEWERPAFLQILICCETRGKKTLLEKKKEEVAVLHFLQSFENLNGKEQGERKKDLACAARFAMRRYQSYVYMMRKGRRTKRGKG